MQVSQQGSLLVSLWQLKSLQADFLCCYCKMGPIGLSAVLLASCLQVLGGKSGWSSGSSHPCCICPEQRESYWSLPGHRLETNHQCLTELAWKYLLPKSVADLEL